MAASDPFAYQVSYENEAGEFTMSAEFSREQAAQMVNTLFRLDSWGNVTRATVVKTDKLLDMRSVEEVEAQVIS